MSEQAKAVLAALLALPPDEQDAVWDAAESAAGVVPDIWDTPEWRAELRRRLDFARDHPEQLIDGETFLSELRAKYANPRPKS